MMRDSFNRSQTTRRGLLMGNAKAIAAIATVALVSKITPAIAKEHEDSYSPGNNKSQGRNTNNNFYGTDNDKPRGGSGSDEKPHGNSYDLGHDNDKSHGSGNSFNFGRDNDKQHGGGNSFDFGRDNGKSHGGSNSYDFDWDHDKAHGGNRNHFGWGNDKPQGRGHDRYYGDHYDGHRGGGGDGGCDKPTGGHSGSGGSGECFLKGTKIQTVAGERRVEELKAGDLLPTAFGGVRPIQWIVRFKRTKTDASKPWRHDARPVRIMKSALAPNVPHADLFVTSGHALLLDGVLVTAKSLVNGTTIAPYAAEEYDELEFFQVKLETHDAIFAEGAACETLLKLDAIDVASSHGESAETEASYCAPVYGNGARSEIKWRAHSALSRWIGPHKVDLIRGRIDERSQVALLGR